MPSRILSVNGSEVKNKQELGAVLKTLSSTAVTFVFLAKRMITKTEKAQELLVKGEELFALKQYSDAMSTLIDAGNLDPHNEAVATSYRNLQQAVQAFVPQQSSTEIMDDGDDDARHPIPALPDFTSCRWIGGRDRG